MYTWNRRGPSPLLCGPPDVTAAGENVFLSLVPDGIVMVLDCQAMMRNLIKSR